MAKPVKTVPRPHRAASQSVTQLKIYPHLNSILQKISQNPIVSVVAPTGTGKSIGIPYAVARTGSKIFVSVPTITAAITLANYQQTINPGTDVGYAAEGRINYNKNTKIVYATAGHLRRKMLNHVRDQVCQPIDFTDVLMVDEAHTGAIDVSVIKYLWGFCYNQKATVPRLILSSATLDPKQSLGEIYKIDLNHYPISIRYHDQTYTPLDQRLLDDTARIATNLHRMSSIDGDFLIFAAGRAEVERIISHLIRLEKVVVLPAYGELSTKDLKAIYQPAPEGHRKIIVATNIAETAITIQNIGVVIDTLIEKLARTSAAGGLRLNPEFISKSSAKQRCGRTGRTGPGICYRMTTETFYTSLKEQRIEEIKRVPIYKLVIEFLNVGLRPERVIPELSNKRSKEAIELLKQLGMVDETNKITKMGRFVVKFPLGVRNAAMIWYWANKNLPLFPIVIMATLIDSYSPPYMIYPRQMADEPFADYQIRLDVHRDTFFNPFEGASDLATMLNWWHDLMDSIGGPRAPIEEVKDWAVEHSFNFRKIREVINVMNQSIGLLKRLKYNVKFGPFTTDGAIDAIRPIVEIAYADQILELRDQRSTIVN